MRGPDASDEAPLATSAAPRSHALMSDGLGYRGITASTELVVLLGDPVGHSLSPVIHNAAFAEQALDLVYLAHAVASGALPHAIDGLWALGARGANVTIPHKRAVLGLASEATETARTLGAANTLRRGDDGWVADNTDVEGFLDPLRIHRQRVSGHPVAVLGAGGAARAVVYAVLRDLSPAHVTVLARRPDQADQLAVDLGAHGDVRVAAMDDREAVRSAALIVNATPVGMDGNATPLAGLSMLHDRHVVYDLIYRPAQTPLLKAAESRGAETINGLPMLLGQAAASYRQWTGLAFPLATARRAALHALGRHG